MLLLQPESFYNEMKLMSEHHEDFPKRIALSEYHIPDTIEAVEPVSYLIKMCFVEPNSFVDEEYIFGLRTFGTFNVLFPSINDKHMQVYYAKSFNGSLWISKPRFSQLFHKDGEMYFVSSDEYGDEYHFTFEEILTEKHNPYAGYSYTTFSEYVFRPENLLAKIPTNLLPHLV